jgi:hypothetical protein
VDCGGVAGVELAEDADYGAAELLSGVLVGAGKLGQ